MARLSYYDLTLDIRYRDFEYGWVQYDILWLWRNQPIIKDALLKRHNDHWNNRSDGAWHANDANEDYLAPLIRRVLDSGVSDFVETLDPDITLAIYAGDGFPFLPSKYTCVYKAPRVLQEEAAHAARKALNPKQPDDAFDLIMFVDAYNFKGCGANLGSGLMLNMQTDRHSLEAFIAELEAEYAEFKVKFDVDRYNAERLDGGTKLNEP